MKLTFAAIELFDIKESIPSCIQIDFPARGEIVDIFTDGTKAYVLVKIEIPTETIKAHFHTIGVNQLILADSFEFVGVFKFKNYKDLEELHVPVARIPVGGFGNTSQEFLQHMVSDVYTETKVEDVNIGSEIHITAPNELDLPDNNPARDIYDLFGVKKPKQKRKYTRKNKKDDTVG